MKTLVKPRRLKMLLFVLILLPTVAVPAQTQQPDPWWHHPIWGPDDEAGGSNWITPSKILRALSLVETGKTYELGHVYERGMPLLGRRSFAYVYPFVSNRRAFWPRACRQ